MKVKINPFANISPDFWYSEAKGEVFNVLEPEPHQNSIWFKLTDHEFIIAKSQYKKVSPESSGLSILKIHCIEMIGENDGFNIDSYGNLSQIEISPSKNQEGEVFIDTTSATTQCLLPNQNMPSDVKIRRFPTGAIRSDNTGRERFDWISPLTLKALAEFLATTENCFAQVNYFKGIPEEACIESLLRHVNDFQINGHKKEAVALLFNAVALVHTICLKERGEYKEIYPTTELINKSDYKEE